MSSTKTPLKKGGSQPRSKAGSFSKRSAPGKGWSLPHVAWRDRTFWSVACFLLVLLILSMAADLSIGPRIRLFMAGDIATETVAAPRNMLVEDFESTANKRRQVAESQPPVYDLGAESFGLLKQQVGGIFETINQASLSQLDDVRWAVSETLNSEISKETFHIWRDEDVQNLVLGRVLPWIQERLAEGVAADHRLMIGQKNGILIHDEAKDIESLLLDPQSLMDIPRLEESLENHLRHDLNRTLRLRKAIVQLLSPLLQPSLTLNREETAARREEASQAVEPVFFRIAKNEVLVRQGERVDGPTQVKLQAMFMSAGDELDFRGPAGAFLLALLLSSSLVLAPRGKLFLLPSPKDFLLLSFVMLLFGAMAKGLAVIEAPLALGLSSVTRDVVPLCLPLAGAAGLLALFFPQALCYSVSLLMAFFACRIFGEGLELFAYYFVSCLVFVNLVKRAETRPQVLKTVLPLTITLLAAWAGMNFMNDQGFLERDNIEAAFVVGGALLSLLLVLALGPVVELLFDYTSRFKLMELMNLEQPLLQDLMVAVPGTYHHSLIVANMVEAGARNVGANALLCKVAALYHDIGKLKNPQYFIENLFGAKNRHDKLAPSMSALILISHVKKGVELARNHKLGKEIADIIQQHHGNSVISFFYHKAMEQAAAKGGEFVRVEDFCYPGPKPQTREAGIVLLADAIEASSRTLADPTPSRIKGHIDSMIKKIFSEGQLDESELTFKDLHILGETFHRILTGIFHQRIPYPNGAPGAKNDKNKGDKQPDKGAQPGVSVTLPARDVQAGGYKQ